MIETSQLQTLVAVANANSFSKAAEDLNVTQSAISQSVKNLEVKLEVQLFQRTGKRVILTQEGEKLYELAAHFLQKLENTLDEVKFDRDSMSGKVRIGTLTGLGKSWLAPLMLQYSGDNSDLMVSINLGFQEDLVHSFENYRLDFLILPEESLPNVGEKVYLGEEKCVLVYPAPQKNAEIKYSFGKDMTLKEFTSHPTILFDELGDGLYLKWCQKRFGKIPRKVNARYAINSHGNMLQAVQRGLGVAVVPKHVLKRSYYKNKVQILEDELEVSNGKFYLVYHKGSEDLLRIRSTITRLLESKNPLS